MIRSPIVPILVSLSLALALAAPPAGLAQTAGAPAGPAIEKGSTVRIEYTVTDEAGKFLDTNKGKQALQFTHGQQQMIPGVERQILGMHPGEEKKVVVKPEEGYGVLDPAAQTEVPKEAIPPDAQQVGKQLLARTKTGQSRVVMVKEVKDQTVVLDLNHPLAGKTLHFDVKVLEVDPPQPGSGSTEPVRPPAQGR